MRFRPFLTLGLMTTALAAAPDEFLRQDVHQPTLQDAALSGTSRSDTVTNTHQTKIRPLPVGPLQIELRFRLRIPPAEAFDLVANRLPEWFGAIHSIKWDHSRSATGPGQTGACSERVCDFGGKALREEIVAFEPGRSYSYRADMARSEMKMPLSDHLGSFVIEQAEGGSVVTWKQYFRARWYMPAFMLRWQMRDRMMRPAINGLISKYGGEWLTIP
ncbi:MAG: SRPBCC family protein [Holophagaceae bacterium]|nr:SRPBCC family protein [Holophagaceae bacterium]